MDDARREITMRYCGGPMDGFEITMEMTPEQLDRLGRTGLSVNSFGARSARHYLYKADPTAQIPPDADSVEVFYQPDETAQIE
jgi:hypothetical protein